MELKPCPFCGGPAKPNNTYGDERDGYTQTVTVRCNGCGARVTASGDTSKGGYADNSTAEARAIEAWDRRVPSTLAQQVASAQAEVATWPEGKLASVKLAGGDQP